MKPQTRMQTLACGARKATLQIILGQEQEIGRLLAILDAAGFSTEWEVGPACLPSGCDQISFSPRERQILREIAAGSPDKQIAAHLGISPRTVRFHLQRIMAKVGAQNRTSAVIKARQLEKLAG